VKFDELADLGRVDNMPAAEYHAIDACSSSALRGCLRNPAKYRHMALTGLSGDSIDFGSTVHAMACEQFDEECAIWEGRRDKRVKAYQEFLEANKGKTIITPKMYDQAAAAWVELQHAVKSSPDANHILDGDTEVSLFWVETVILSDGSEEQIPCKARADVLNTERKFLTDVKTAKDASPYGFKRAVKSWNDIPGYDVQAGWYIRGCERVLDERAHWQFYFAAVENKAPFCASTHIIDENYLTDTVHDLVHLGLQKWADCWISGVWPGYDNRLNWIL